MFEKQNKTDQKQRITLTTLLVIILLMVIIIFQAIFISGPYYYYQDSINKQQEIILKQHPGLTNFKRHVFKYVTYVAQSDSAYCWFNEEGELLTYRYKDTTQFQKVSALAKQYGSGDVSVSLGYGYYGPAYILENDYFEVIIDYDTLEEVHYFRKGD